MVTSSSDQGSAKAFGINDTDTLIGMIFTSTALRAGAILVLILPYIPSEMILVQFPPCTESGHDWQGVHCLMEHLNLLPCMFGAIQGPDDAGRYI